MGKIRIGVFGATRGYNVINFCVASELAEVVAICDKQEAVFERQKEYLRDTLGYTSITYYTGFDEFVELVEAVEESGKIYAYGENFCYMPVPYEMRKLYREGKIGEFEYGEGEYIHNCMPGWASLTYGDPNHWRNNMYANFYCTHSIGPLIHITGLRPVSVIGLKRKMNERKMVGGAKSGLFGIEMITLNNGGIVKRIHGDLYKGSSWYSLSGSKGRMESGREDAERPHNHMIYVNVDEYTREGERKQNYASYSVAPENSDIKKSGHLGADYIIMTEFLKKISGDKDADVIDVYEALDMFLPGMFAYRSVLKGGVSVEVPDLRDPAVREQYRNDTMCTDPKVAGDMLIPVFSEGNPEIPNEIYEIQKKTWEKELANKTGYVNAAIIQGRIK